MKKTYKIEVDCAACALKMEDAAKKVEGVADATVSFMTQKMKVEFADGSDEKAVMENVVKACKRVEDDCEIYLQEFPGKEDKVTPCQETETFIGKMFPNGRQEVYYD